MKKRINIALLMMMLAVIVHPSYALFGLGKDKSTGEFSTQNDLSRKARSATEDLLLIIRSEEPADLIEVQELLGKGADPNAVKLNHLRSDDGSVLVWAILNMHGRDIIDALISAGASPSSMAAISPLTAAVAKGRTDIVEVLIELGVEPIVEEKYSHPLYYSALNGREEFCRLLLMAGVPPDSVGPRGQTTPLYEAAYKGDVKLVKLFLDAGADPDHLCNVVKTPLLIAAENGYVEVVRILLGAGADPDVRILKGEFRGYKIGDGYIRNAHCDYFEEKGVLLEQTLIDAGAELLVELPRFTDMWAASRDVRSILTTLLELSNSKQWLLTAFVVLLMAYGFTHFLWRFRGNALGLPSQLKLGIGRMIWVILLCVLIDWALWEFGIGVSSWITVPRYISDSNPATGTADHFLLLLFAIMLLSGGLYKRKCARGIRKLDQVIDQIDYYYYYPPGGLAVDIANDKVAIIDDSCEWVSDGDYKNLVSKSKQPPQILLLSEIVNVSVHIQSYQPTSTKVYVPRKISGHVSSSGNISINDTGGYNERVVTYYDMRYAKREVYAKTGIKISLDGEGEVFVPLGKKSVCEKWKKLLEENLVESKRPRLVSTGFLRFNAGLNRSLLRQGSLRLIKRFLMLCIVWVMFLLFFHYQGAIFKLVEPIFGMVDDFI